MGEKAIRKDEDTTVLSSIFVKFSELIFSKNLYQKLFVKLIDRFPTVF